MALLAPKLSGNSCVSCLQSRRQPPRLDVGGRLSDRTVARAAKLPKNNSFDADDELDNDLANELAKFRSHEAWERMASHLDLVWKVGRSRGKRSECGCCNGTGLEECHWCHGTGAMMVGDRLFRSADGASHCPICKGKGYTSCENCRGTGYRASWLGPDHCRNPSV
eukprot:GHUV01011533.1.p1 GENE.GHUV01011533.1~~GHUV01011533.1.p1  ORF type:complete len:166 (+),score=9.81 GHUV01011533.1:236-733(+)